MLVYPEDKGSRFFRKIDAYPQIHRLNTDKFLNMVLFTFFALTFSNLKISPILLLRQSYKL